MYHSGSTFIDAADDLAVIDIGPSVSIQMHSHQLNGSHSLVFGTKGRDDGIAAINNLRDALQEAKTQLLLKLGDEAAAIVGHAAAGDPAGEGPDFPAADQ